MSRGKSTKAIAAIQEKMEKLQAELEAAMKQQAADIGNLAVASGRYTTCGTKKGICRNCRPISNSRK